MQVPRLSGKNFDNMAIVSLIAAIDGVLDMLIL